nr:hypothetical protein B0A51_17166 [Rachicladosporium sp. CCFEE 5018]
MAQSKTLKQPVLTPPKLTPPSINRQHSYNVSSSTSPVRSWSSTCTNARSFLSQVASRTASPRRTTSNYVGSSTESSPTEAPPMERRRSWEDCVHQRDGYVSFPDYDTLKEGLVGEKER